MSMKQLLRFLFVPDESYIANKNSPNPWLTFARWVLIWGNIMFALSQYEVWCSINNMQDADKSSVAFYMAWSIFLIFDVALFSMINMCTGGAMQGTHFFFLLVASACAHIALLSAEASTATGGCDSNAGLSTVRYTWNYVFQHYNDGNGTTLCNGVYYQNCHIYNEAASSVSFFVFAGCVMLVMGMIWFVHWLYPTRTEDLYEKYPHLASMLLAGNVALFMISLVCTNTAIIILAAGQGGYHDMDKINGVLATFIIMLAMSVGLWFVSISFDFGFDDD